MFLKQAQLKKTQIKPLLQRQAKGMALIAVIFIMVIMSGAVLMMSRLADMQAAERTMDLMAARAQSSAKAGLQWAIKQIQDNGSCPGASTTFAMDAESDLSGFSVTVNCDTTDFIEGLNTITLYNVLSEASFSGIDTTGEYVFRRLTAVVELESS